MNADEFVKRCVMSGYATAQTAREYAAGKEDFTEQDIEEIWRINERRLDLDKDQVDRGRWRVYNGVKTTKKLYYDERGND